VLFTIPINVSDSKHKSKGNRYLGLQSVIFIFTIRRFKKFYKILCRPKGGVVRLGIV
jgi:hypothetical protein